MSFRHVAHTIVKSNILIRTMFNVRMRMHTHDVYVRHDRSHITQTHSSCRFVMSRIRSRPTHVRHASSHVTYRFIMSCRTYTFALKHESNMHVRMSMYEMTSIMSHMHIRHVVRTHSHKQIRIMCMCEYICEA